MWIGTPSTTFPFAQHPFETIVIYAWCNSNIGNKSKTNQNMEEICMLSAAQSKNIITHFTYSNAV